MAAIETEGAAQSLPAEKYLFAWYFYKKSLKTITLKLVLS
jgi:hypothetical protein